MLPFQHRNSTYNWVCDNNTFILDLLMNELNILPYDFNSSYYIWTRYGSRATSEECPHAIIVMCLQSIIGVLSSTCMAGIVFAKLSRTKVLQLILVAYWCRRILTGLIFFILVYELILSMKNFYCPHQNNMLLFISETCAHHIVF